MATLKGLAQLRKAGGIVPREPVRKTVTWVHVDKETGETHEDTMDVLIVRQASGMVADLLEAKDRKQWAMLLSLSVVFEDEKGAREPLKYDDAIQFDEGLAGVLLQAIQEVNSGPKNSVSSTSSIASLSSAESAAEPLKKPESA